MFSAIAGIVANVVEGVASNAITNKMDADKPEIITELEKMRGVMTVSIYRCKRCGAFIGQYTDCCDYFRPRYCSNCGAKVVKHGER